MEKSTISALVIAGAAVVIGVLQALALRAVKRKREASEAATQEKQADSAESPNDA